MLCRARTTALAWVKPRIMEGGVEPPGGHRHTVVRRPHVSAGVSAGAARRLAHLVDKHLLEPRDIAALELPVDPVVASATGHERVDHRRDRLETTEPLIQGRHLNHPIPSCYSSKPDPTPR